MNIRDERNEQKTAIIEILETMVIDARRGYFENASGEMTEIGTELYFAENDITPVTEPEGEIVYSPPLNQTR